MDVTKAGRWLDVGQDDTYPFVCARYTAQCPSVAKFFNNSAVPINTVQQEGDSTTYDTGTVLTVTCVNSKKDIQSEIECKPNGQFQPSSLLCPVVTSSAISRNLTFSYLLFIGLCVSIFHLRAKWWFCWRHSHLVGITPGVYVTKWFW
eukprot:sb/3473716/